MNIKHLEAPNQTRDKKSHTTNHITIPIKINTLLKITSLTFLSLMLYFFGQFGQALADETLKLQPVTENVYAIVGELGNRSQKNLANNATFGFVITTQGIVLIDSGGSYQGAKKIHQLIKTVSNKPITTVINTGGQDHRWLGNGYFKKQGAQIIANDKAVTDQKKRTPDQLALLNNLVGEERMGDTKAVYANKTFTQKLLFTKGNTQFQIHHSGQAHTPGDSYVWLPQQKVMFTGDIVYIQRMLGIGLQSNSKSWISTFKAMSHYQSKHLIPGHGKATNLAHAQKDTYDYLIFLRQAVSEFMEQGGDIADISRINQAKFNYLSNFKTLAGRNAQQVFTEIEWE